MRSLAWRFLMGGAFGLGRDSMWRSSEETAPISLDQVYDFGLNLLWLGGTLVLCLAVISTLSQG